MSKKPQPKRAALGKLGMDERHTFRGEFVREGTKRGYMGFPERTLLVRNVRIQGGDVLTDHQWFSYCTTLEALGPLQEGDVIQFNARVSWYERGYKGRREDVWDAPIERDLRLIRPTKVVRLNGVNP